MPKYNRHYEETNDGELYEVWTNRDGTETNAKLVEWYEDSDDDDDDDTPDGCETCGNYPNYPNCREGCLD